MADGKEAPFPLSRETTIRIDRDGEFWHDGERVQNDKLARAFARWVDVDPESGRYILKNEVDWCFVTVDDAPLVVRALEVGPGGELRVALSDGTTEPLDLATLRVDEDDVPYCDVRGGALPARFSRAAAFALLERVRVAEEGALRLSAGGGEVPVRRVPRGQGGARPPRKTEAGS